MGLVAKEARALHARSHSLGKARMLSLKPSLAPAAIRLAYRFSQKFWIPLCSSSWTFSRLLESVFSLGASRVFAADRDLVRTGDGPVSDSTPNIRRT